MPMSQEFKDKLFPVLPKIAEYFGTPFHIYDGEGIVNTVSRMQNAFAKHGIDYKEFYAVKALPKPAIINLLFGVGCGFDCSSVPEVLMAINAGVRGEDIMFTSNNTSSTEFIAATLHGCAINLDDEIFIDKLPRPFPDLICFRLNPGMEKTGDEVNAIIGDPYDSKYGVPIERIQGAYRKAKEKGATRFGLHTMVCSNDRDYKHMVKTVELLLRIARLLNKDGIPLEFINMGGGIGIPYRREEKEFDIEALARECASLLGKFDEDCGYAPKLFTESGRYVTGPHGVLVNKVINVYQKYKRFVGVEAAMAGLMRVGMYSTAYHHCTLLDPSGEERVDPLETVTVAGPICENCDVLARNIKLPWVREGDILVTHDTGAHGSAMCFNYNGRTRVQELLLQSDGKVRRICRAETYQDLDQRHQNLDGPEHVLGL